MNRDLANASDVTLAMAIARWDQEALAEVYRRNAGPVFGLARRVLGDAAVAEEVVQEVFLRLWHEPGRYDPERGSLRTFLLSQVHSRAVDMLRSDTARRQREVRATLVRRPRANMTSSTSSWISQSPRGCATHWGSCNPASAAPSNLPILAATPIGRWHQSSESPRARSRAASVQACGECNHRSRPRDWPSVKCNLPRRTPDGCRGPYRVRGTACRPLS